MFRNRRRTLCSELRALQSFNVGIRIHRIGRPDESFGAHVDQGLETQHGPVNRVGGAIGNDAEFKGNSHARPSRDFPRAQQAQLSGETLARPPTAVLTLAAQVLDCQSWHGYHSESLGLRWLAAGQPY